MFRIRTRDIQFVSRDSLACIELVDDFQVFVFVKTKYIDEHGATRFSQERHLVLDERINADIFQADGVQHTRRGRKQARRKIAVDRPRRCSFHANGANAAKFRESLEFLAVSECSACRNDWIIKKDSRQVDTEIDVIHIDSI